MNILWKDAWTGEVPEGEERIYWRYASEFQVPCFAIAKADAPPADAVEAADRLRLCRAAAPGGWPSWAMRAARVLATQALVTVDPSGKVRRGPDGGARGEEWRNF